MDAANEQSMMAFEPDMAEILDSFLIESKELMEKLGSDLMDLEQRPTDSDLLNTIFRAVHTLKGTSSFLGFMQFTELSHHFEDLLNAARRGTVIITPAHIDYSLIVYDQLREMLDDIENKSIPHYELNEYFVRLKELSDTAVPTNDTPVETAALAATSEEMSPAEIAQTEIPSAPSQSATAATSSPDDERARAMAEALASLQSVIAEKHLEPLSIELPALTASSDVSSENTVTLQAQKMDDAPLIQFSPAPPSSHEELKPEPKTELKSEPKSDSKPEQKIEQKVETKPVTAKDNLVKNAESTIRVDVQRLDSLMNLVGELVLGRNRFSQLIHKLNDEMDTHPIVKELLETSTHIDFISTELQAAVMSTRMVSMAKIYNKLPRLVRDLCKEMSKDIDLQLSGEDTELDKTLIEELNDPFIHLLRNAADHGVETPEEREKLGKPRKGTISVKAEHAGNHIAISIIDDGKGMDPAVLKNVAISRGVITEQEAEHMSDQEAFKLIFMPGFSTAKKITNVSGRGVGMDVVKTNILKLKGSISIDSQLGRGSVFTIKLPLTLAIIQALLVEVKDEIFSMPLESVIEVIRLERSDVQTIQSREATLLRGNVLPLIRLNEVMGRDSAAPRTEDSFYTVVMQFGEQRIGLIVDNLLGQREIVIKSLGAAFEGIRGVSGSTILGDGRVIMILDVPEIMKMCTSSVKELA